MIASLGMLKGQPVLLLILPPEDIEDLNGGETIPVDLPGMLAGKDMPDGFDLRQMKIYVLRAPSHEAALAELNRIAQGGDGLSNGNGNGKQ